MNAYCLKYCVRSDNKNRCRAKYSSSVSRLLFDEFSWNFSIRSLHACATNGVVGVRAVKMNGTSFGQQITFSSVSRLPFGGFCWSFKRSNFHACATNCLCFVAIDQERRVPYLEQSTFSLYLCFYSRNFLGNPYFAVSLHAQRKD